jgi:two-component system cell cycle sensor histidine kinase/response regulator CckA
VAQGLEFVLQEVGYAVSIVSSGNAALKFLQSAHPDLILMDIQLEEGMDGIETSNQIRNFLDIPIVFITGYTDPPTLERAKHTEPSGYLTKPFDHRTLRTTIEMAIYKHQMDQKLRQSERRLASLLRCIGDGVIAADNSGSVIFINPMAEKLTGWMRDEVLGGPVRDVYRIASERTQVSLPGESPESHAKVVPSANEFVLIRKDGSEMPVKETITSIYDDQNQIAGVVLIFHEITDRKRAERERERLFSTLEISVRAERQLRQLLPVCAQCDSVQEDSGDWMPLTSFVARRTPEKNPSHRLCPNCQDKTDQLANGRAGKA